MSYQFSRSARNQRPARLRAAGIVVASLLVAMTGGLAQAAELVMFESPGCHYCQQWIAEIGPIYPKTAESRRAPLRHVNLHEPRPEALRGFRAVSFTPTFVLVEDGAELGRITGYGGEDLFWFQLGALMQKLPEG